MGRTGSWLQALPFPPVKGRGRGKSEVRRNNKSPRGGSLCGAAQPQLMNFMAASYPRKQAAFAGKARARQGVKPRYRPATPSAL